MNKAEILNENRIPYQRSGDDLITHCPFCLKTDTAGRPVGTFHIEEITGNGNCSNCLRKVKWDEIVRTTELKIPSKDKRAFTSKPPRIEKSAAPVADESKIIEGIIPTLKPISVEELTKILGLTIKHDEQNKLATFLCQLSAYSKDSQLNLSYNAPSSTGKSFIPMEIAQLFPRADVIELAYCSPTAFFHEGVYDEARDAFVKDYSRKIIIFLDQPHPEVLARLRPLLSHDKKEIVSKITDKMKAKNIILIGFPAVIFCSAGLHINDQEATRFLLLSPEISQEKIHEGIIATIKKESDSSSYQNWLNENPERKLLKNRILAIRYENIQEIKIASPEKIEKQFLETRRTLKPKNQRDIKHVIDLVKCFALLNLWWRERNGLTITANDDDIESAFKLWLSLSPGQEWGLPPYIYDMYKDVILPAWHEKNGITGFDDNVKTEGIMRNEFMIKHIDVYHRSISPFQLSQEILPMLERAGFIIQEKDPKDLRQKLIRPLPIIVSDDKPEGKQ